jgi:hypothetical protein
VQTPLGLPIGGRKWLTTAPAFSNKTQASEGLN